MEPSENDRLTDRELDSLLQQWNAPSAPARLRAALFPGTSRRWWQRLWHVSIRVPVPVAACLAIAFGLAAWRWSMPAHPQVVVKTERVEVPVTKERVVTKTVYRDRCATQGLDIQALQPVAELRPRIIRRRNVEN
jgi:hypothetical protein